MVINTSLPAGRQGFTLVELLIVITILAILMVMALAALNPIALINKGNDARRKKDIGRIKVAFEEYANDNKGCYPLTSMFDSYTCGGDFFGSQLPNFPCDPSGVKYLVVTDDSDCPKWFKVTTKLANLLDTNIPPNWSYSADDLLGGALNRQNSNYGVSSTNINWYEVYVDPTCKTPDLYSGQACYIMTTSCTEWQCVRPNGSSSSPKDGCRGDNCYIESKVPTSNNCRLGCKVKACGYGLETDAHGVYDCF